MTRRVALLLLLAALAAASARTGNATSDPRTVELPAAGVVVPEAVAVRTRPSAKAPRVSVLHAFRRDYRRQVVLATARRIGADGVPWYRLSLAMRPNGTTGWVRASQVDVAPVVTRIAIRRGARTLTVYRRGRALFRTTVAVGAPGMETPLGTFYVTARFRPADSFLGSFAFETSAYSKLSEWPGGGVVGIHGTSMPWLLGRAVSHGCVRISNAAALRLKQLVPVGTPIEISA